MLCRHLIGRETQRLQAGPIDRNQVVGCAHDVDALEQFQRPLHELITVEVGLVGALGPYSNLLSSRSDARGGKRSGLGIVPKTERFLATAPIVERELPSEARLG